MKSTKLIEKIRQIENRSEIPYFDITFDECEELVNELENQSKWVDINDRLPDTDRDILVFNKDQVTDMMVAYYHELTGDFLYITDYGDQPIHNVTAWMELPKPFKS